MAEVTNSPATAHVLSISKPTLQRKPEVNNEPADNETSDIDTDLFVVFQGEDPPPQAPTIQSITLLYERLDALLFGRALPPGAPQCPNPQQILEQMTQIRDFLQNPLNRLNPAVRRLFNDLSGSLASTQGEITDIQTAIQAINAQLPLPPGSPTQQVLQQRLVHARAMHSFYSYLTGATVPGFPPPR